MEHPLTLPDPGATARTRVRRLPEKAVRDRTVLHDVLDAGRVAHLGLAGPDGQPWVLPVAYARDGERVLMHGSTGSRLFRRLASGEPTCLTVTLVDGLVVARSAFESSMHYRSAMVLGRCTPLRAADKRAALDVITDRLMPGRRTDVRPPTRRELAATLVVALPLDEASVKVSAGPPGDPPADAALPIWAGVVPLREQLGTPVPAPDLAPGIAVPGYLRRWRR